MVNPVAPFGAAAKSIVGRLGPRVDLWGLVFCLLFLGGCGSTANLVKENLDYRPAVANAFSRAIEGIGFGKKAQSASVPSSASQAASATGYPPLPKDENDPRVRQFVRHYAYGQRETMKQYLARAEEYMPLVKSVAREHALPEDLAYLVMLESGADPEARSPANALGMWQFMPATARSYGLRVDSWVDERLDPWKSTRSAMLYLKDLYGMFGCWRLALSAYNSGENKLNKVLCQEDANEYEKICSSKKLRRETREFLPRFQAIAIIAKNPQKYGFAPIKEVPREDKHEMITVKGCYSLDSLARCMDVPASTIVELNPALVRSKTPSEGAPCPVRLPLGKKQVLAQKLEKLPEATAPSHIVHVVDKGDNLSKILRRYQIKRSQLADLNPDVNLRRRLRHGSKIVIPVEKSDSKKAHKGQRFSHLQ